MSIYLGFKEVWRNKGRFFLFSLVIALIAVLVLFTAGLGEGLASANKEYLEKLDAQLLVFQSETNYSTIESRLDYDKLAQAAEVDGVDAAGPIGFSNVKVVFDGSQEAVDVSYIGVESGKPGAPAVIEGGDLSSDGNTVLIDERLAKSTGLAVGDTITIKSTQGTEDQFFDLEVTGITEGQRYFFRPSIFVDLETWQETKPSFAPGLISQSVVPNVIAVRLTDPDALESMSAKISAELDGVDVTDIKTAYQAAPGYSAQQNTLNTIKGFTFLIGALVIGGFFQIQTLQKIPQIGMLKAIGAPNQAVANAAIFQIIFVTILGVALGGLAVLGLTLAMPDEVPIFFTGTSILIAVGSLLLIGPVGGMVSVRLALKTEPLTALGM
ncbi:MAG: ABC transporter permease [Anaerolineales bacterium]